MKSDIWRPSASLRHLEARQRITQRIREFFEGDCLEVETPILGSAPGGHLDETHFSTSFRSGKKKLFLQGSPESKMKRLLAAGSGDIFQLTKAFRQDCLDRAHSPEFTILEWYRLCRSYLELMREVEELVRFVGGDWSFQRVSFRDLFMASGLRDPADSIGWELLEGGDQGSLTGKIDLEHQLAELIRETCDSDAVFIYDFPPSMACLAQLGEAEGIRFAQRFELYIGGLEIANGYQELRDASEQRSRGELELRLSPNTDGILDELLLEALASGLPECSGVAVGFDRLVMLLVGAKAIAEVVSFSIDRC